MADTKISALTAAGALTGSEAVPVVQGGATKRTTLAAVAALAAAPAGVPIVHALPFAFNTLHLSDGTGAALYTPTVGDLLLDAWVNISTNWDGTTPNGDVGDPLNNSAGLFTLTGAVLDMTASDQQPVFGSGHNLSASQRTAIINTTRLVPAKFVNADPVCVWVTQDGTSGGADPASTQGAATLYLVTATPA